MKKTLFFILVAAFCFSLSAQNQPAKHFQDVKISMHAPPASGGSDDANFVPSQRPSTFVPQTRGESFDIGETNYIVATNRNARNTINWSPDGSTCAVTWTMGNYPARYRGTGINYFNYDIRDWDPMPSLDPLARIETGPENANWGPGWGTHVYTKEGECVISHITQSNFQTEGGMLINYKEKRGEGDWAQSLLKGPVLKDGKTDILWSTVCAVEDVIHMVCVTSQDTVSAYNGYTCYPLYFRSTDGGKSWEDIRGFQDLLTEIELDGSSADVYAITARENHVVIAYISRLEFNACYLESLDGGNTWEKKVAYETGWDWYSTGVFVGPTLGATTVGVAIGDDEVVHLAFSVQSRYRRADDPEGSGWYNPKICGMFTWNDKQPTITGEWVDQYLNYDITQTNPWLSPVHTLDTLPNFLNAPGLLGLDKFYFWEPNVDLFKNYSDVGYVSHPRLIAQNGKVYLMYSSIIEQPMVYNGNPEAFYRGVFLTVSHDNGESYDQKRNTSWISYHPEIFWCDWSAFQSYDTTHNGMVDMEIHYECGYPTMASNIVDNTLVFTWFSDIYPFPEPTSSGNVTFVSTAFRVMSANMKTWEAGVVNNTDSVWRNLCNKIEEKEAIHNLKIYPNPASDKITLETGTNNLYTLTVSNIMGQVLYSTKGMNSKVDLNVANYPAGIYIVNVKTAHATASKKLIIK